MDSKKVLGALCVDKEYFVKNQNNMDELFSEYSQFDNESFYQKLNNELELEYCLLITFDL